MAAQEKEKGRNPAIGFLIMAGFNVVGAIVFVVFYFLYRGADGQQSWLLLLAALVSLLAGGGLVVAYNVFRRKLQPQNRQ